MHTWKLALESELKYGRPLKLYVSDVCEVLDAFSEC